MEKSLKLKQLGGSAMKMLDHPVFKVIYYSIMVCLFFIFGTPKIDKSVLTEAFNEAVKDSSYIQQVVNDVDELKMDNLERKFEFIKKQAFKIENFSEDIKPDDLTLAQRYFCKILEQSEKEEGNSVLNLIVTQLEDYIKIIDNHKF